MKNVIVLTRNFIFNRGLRSVSILQTVKKFSSNQKMSKTSVSFYSSNGEEILVKMTWNNLEIVKPKFVEENSSN